MSALLVVAIGLSVVACGVLWLFANRHRYGVATLALCLPFGLGSITYYVREHDRELAWKLYVELKTRKAALPFDEENDLIAEVYDSLYELFPITRQLLAALPLGEAQRPTGIADLMMRVQNDGLRPHLTRWQAAFRRWWDKAVEVPENEGKSPQELQRQYPLYTDLVADLKRTNDDLSKYAEELLKIVRSSGPKFPKPRIRGRKAARPIPPSTRVATSSLGVGSRRESGSPPVPDDQGGGQL